MSSLDHYPTETLFEAARVICSYATFLAAGGNRRLADRMVERAFELVVKSSARTPALN